MYVGINLIFMHKKSQELGGGCWRGGEQKEGKLEICERGIGAYFTKEEFCIAFWSCKQNPLEKKYHKPEKEHKKSLFCIIDGPEKNEMLETQ